MHYGMRTVESSDVIIVAMEEKLLVAILVVDNAKRCGVVHDLAVDVVEEVVANATPLHRPCPM